MPHWLRTQSGVAPQTTASSGAEGHFLPGTAIAWIFVRGKGDSRMLRIIVPTLVVAFAAVMTYAIYLQARIWHLL